MVLYSSSLLEIHPKYPSSSFSQFFIFLFSFPFLIGGEGLEESPAGCSSPLPAHSLQWLASWPEQHLFPQIHFLIWTNTFCNWDKYVWQFRKIIFTTWSPTASSGLLGQGKHHLFASSQIFPVSFPKILPSQKTSNVKHPGFVNALKMSHICTSKVSPRLQQQKMPGWASLRPT